MDRRTISIYDELAEEIASVHAQLTPHRLYELAEKYFRPSGKILDLGCGIGRDSAWLKKNNFHAIGVDASKGMLEQGRKLYPHIDFVCDQLPDLETFSDNQFDGVFCSAVVMHLPQEQIARAMLNIMRILRKQGVALISYRSSNSKDEREGGKLYTPINPVQLIQFASDSGASLVHQEAEIEDGRGHTWYNLVFRK